MANADPDLAAKLALMSLPVAAKRINGQLTYDLTVQGWGTYRVSKRNGDASVDAQPERPDVDRPDPRPPPRPRPPPPPPPRPCAGVGVGGPPPPPPQAPPPPPPGRG